ALFEKDSTLTLWGLTALPTALADSAKSGPRMILAPSFTAALACATACEALLPESYMRRSMLAPCASAAAIRAAFLRLRDSHSRSAEPVPPGARSATWIG